MLKACLAAYPQLFTLATLVNARSIIELGPDAPRGLNFDEFTTYDSRDPHIERT
jgi:hypothetical protein